MAGLLVLAFVLAGCSEPEPAPTEGTPEDCACAADGLAKPAWAVRDFWTYATGDGSLATYVITAEQGTDWIMETDNPDREFFNAREDVSRLGPQRKSDLAGSQGSDRVQFFQWPLSDGQSWTTTWDHVPVTVTASHDPGASTADLEAKDANGTVVYRYTYDAEAGWFSDLKHLNPDGSELVTLRLTASGHNWTGQVARWDLQTITDVAGDLSAATPPQQATFDVPLTATDVWASIAVSCTSGAVSVGLAPMPVAPATLGLEPRGAGEGGTPCPVESVFVGSAGAPKAPPQGGTAETWGWSADAAPGGVGTYRMEILVRTLTPVAVP